ncbi:hypothetical protein AVW11_04100 [Streptomyces amritsarensis]|uniref:Secreted protein n=1 Tax=Streptomyces amritsarensis TaxID=681158 RepID=A0ABX3GCD3_9ACTN|nr:hypothetical protein AVW11_04100 [Streptomyces amritsarensis]
MWTAVSGGVVGVASAVATFWGGRAARRTRRDHRRDDFKAITERMDKEFDRRDERIDELEAKTELQEQRLEGASVAIIYLIGRVRGLTGYIRSVGMEPPAADPVPDPAKQFIHDFDL